MVQNVARTPTLFHHVFRCLCIPDYQQWSLDMGQWVFSLTCLSGLYSPIERATKEGKGEGNSDAVELGTQIFEDCNLVSIYRMRIRWMKTRKVSP